MKLRVLSKYIPLILIILSFIPMIAFFHPGLPQGHDAQDHVVRIANFYQSLTEGIIIPRWAGNLNWGYGHPVLMFLYPFSSYCASFLHAVGFSLVDATKGVFVLAYVFSLLSMYLWMSSVWGKRIGVLGALLFGFAPYRFVDIYVRMAIGEHMAFVFPPLVFYFLYKLARRGTLVYGLGLGASLASLILSHNAISLMFLPIFGLYALYLFFFEAKRSWIFIVLGLLGTAIGFGLSAFFWLPALLEGKFTLRDIVTAGEAIGRFVPWTWFFYSPWNYGGTTMLTKSLGFFQWVGVLSGCIVIYKSKDARLRLFLIVSLLILIGSLFIMTSASTTLWKSVMLLQNIQFPWRFLSVSVFISAVLGSIGIVRLIELLQFQRAIKTYDTVKDGLFALFCIFTIFSTFYMWHPKNYLVKHESFYTGIYFGTTDTGESSPIWTTRFMEHTAPNPMEVISGEASVQVGKRTSTIHEYHVSAKTRAQLLENTLFFPGWKITVDGIGAGIQYQDGNHRGIMSFWIDEGEHDVRVQFLDTKLRKIAGYISLGTLLGCIVIGIGVYVWTKRR